MKLILRICRALLLSVVLAVSPSLAETLTIGVAPHVNGPASLDAYQPLRQYLQRALRCDVQVVTAPDFNEFARRSVADAYDLAITTTHQGRLLQTDAHYIPLLTYKGEVRFVIVVSGSSPVSRLRELDAKVVVGVSPASEVTLWGRHWLKVHQAEAIFRNVGTPGNLAGQVADGEAAAGFMSLADYQKLPEQLRDRLRILAKSSPRMHGVYLVSAEWLGKRAQLEAALWDFAATPEAKRFFSDNEMEGFRRLKSYEMNAYDKYAAVLRKELAEKGR